MAQKETKQWFNYNGRMWEEGTGVISADNRGFRYGDGLFETMRVENGQILRKTMHFERLFTGMEFLQISLPALVGREILEKEILDTIQKNRIQGAARIRLMVFRGDGGLYEAEGAGGGYIIQAWKLPQSVHALNENGLDLGVFTEANKPCDRLANVKSNNYLIYIMAALYTKQQRLNDSLVLNVYGRVCDATIANVFWVKEEHVYTVPLEEGCVAGVMRRHLLETLPNQGIAVTEKPVSLDEIREADEIFLTNAIYGLKWVKSLHGQSYGNHMAKRIFDSTI